MIVLDASALLELLLNTGRGRAVAARLADPSVVPCVPHLADIEILHVLRRLVASGSLSADRARAALEDLAALDLERYGHEALFERIWQLRDDLTAYDAAYVALAEGLAATLLTCDGHLARAPGVRARVELVSG